MPLTTPTLDEIIDVPVRFTAPERAGRYWLLITVAGEPSGGFALSATNWSVERPLWGDGNDVAQLPDNVIEQANLDGYATIKTAFPKEWERGPNECAPASSRSDRPPRTRTDNVKYCITRLGLVGIRVIVTSATP